MLAAFFYKGIALLNVKSAYLFRYKLDTKILKNVFLDTIRYLILLGFPRV